MAFQFYNGRLVPLSKLSHKQIVIHLIPDGEGWKGRSMKDVWNLWSLTAHEVSNHKMDMGLFIVNGRDIVTLINKCGSDFKIVCHPRSTFIDTFFGNIPLDFYNEFSEVMAAIGEISPVPECV